MTARRKKLGRGLEALLGDAHTDSDSAAEEGLEFRLLALVRIKRSRYQPRTNMDEEALEQLAQSIRNQGVIQPIVVRRLGRGDYELVAGERRWRAAQMAGLHDIPARICNLSDQEALGFALVENLQRQDLNIVEQANGMDRLLKEFGLTHEQLAQTLGRSRESVTNTMRLLKLAKGALRLLEKGKLEMGHGRALLGAPENRQTELAQQAVKEGLSVRQVEKLVANMKLDAEKAAQIRRQSTQLDADVLRLCRDLSDALGAEVEIQQRFDGAGRMVVRYGSPEELQGILQRMGQTPED